LTDVREALFEFMNLVCIGISHHTAPLEMRERLWFSEQEIKDALSRFRREGIGEAVLFSTCNRTELYVYDSRPDLRVKTLQDLLLSQKGTTARVSPDLLFTYFASGAADHLFRVASGIDSMIVGDVQILSQIKEGFQLSQENNASGFFMNKLFQAAFHVGKRARTETAISEGAVSVSYAAVELAERIFENLGKKSALVIGAGETAQLTAKHLKSHGIGRLLITNRTSERAEILAREVGGSTIPFDDFCNHLTDVDIIITSVLSDTFVLSVDDIRGIVKRRKASTLFVIDIGVPRNIDPASKEIEGIFLYDIDALQGMIDENLQKRQSEIPKIEAIVGHQVSELSQWYTSLHVTPTIAALREHFETVRGEEVAKNINRFTPHERELVEILTKRILNKILHRPTINLKNGQSGASSESLLKISVLRDLFGLGSDRRDEGIDD